MALAQAVLRGPSSLTEGERELLAAAVSAENHCEFCAQSHGATARVLLGPQAPWVDEVLSGGLPDDPKLAALTVVARETARSVQGADEAVVAAARLAGATDRDLHDAVLVAAAFSLYNRYVDGLGAPMPPDLGAYAPMGAHLARSGYH
jgi:uncharacterized peroxidase-related enzyme